MKHFLLWHLLFSIPNVIAAQSIKDLYTNYQSALNRCGSCMEDAAYGSEMSNYDLALTELNRELRNNEDAKNYPFLSKALLMRILQDRVHLCASRLSGQISIPDTAAVLRTLLTPLVEKRRTLPRDAPAGFTDFTQEFNKLRKRDRAIILTVFNMADESRAEFDQNIWRKITIDIDSVRQEKEDALYTALVDEASVQKLENFIGFSPYDATVKDYNHNADEAFVRLFRLLTADGESNSIADFNAKYDNLAKRGSYSILKTLLKSEQYISVEKAQTDSATNWQRLAYGRNQSNETPLRLAYAAHKHEIGFVAFTKWAWNNIMAAKYDTVFIVINELQQLLSKEKDLMMNRTKLNNYSKILSKIEQDDKFLKRNIQPLANGNTPNNEIYFFLNKLSSYLAIIPYGNGNIKRYSIDTKILDLSPQGPEVEAVPYTYVHWFSNLKGFPDDLAAPRHVDFKIDNKVIGNASDFFFSADGNILFFAGIAKNQEIGTLNNSYYPYFNNTNGISTYQESKINPTPYHGKPKGAPNTDIFYTVKTKGLWSTPKPLPGCINTPYSERSPTLSLDGRTLYFASEGHAGLGGYDIFSITINPEDLSTPGEPENVYYINSNKDELFYNELSINEDIVFISSNRGLRGDFDLYKVVLKERVHDTIPPPLPKTLSGPVLDSPKPPVEFDSAGLIIIEEPKCERVDTVSPLWPNGYVMIMGNVYYNNRKPVDNVNVYIYDRAGISYPDIVKKGNRYNITVPIEMQEFKLVAEVFSADGRKIVHQAQEFIDLEKCLEYVKSDEPFYVKKDIVTKVISGFTEQEMPFFFDTNIWNSTISIEKLLRRYFDERCRSPYVEIICEGYADERGPTDYNKELSTKRAKFVYDFLINKVGVPASKISYIGQGETSTYTGDSFDKYVKSLTFSVDTMDFEAKKLMLNRRVVVKIKR